MKISQKKWTKDMGWQEVSPELKKLPQLVLLFGSSDQLSKKSTFKEIKSMYKGSTIISASTAGEIIGSEVLDNSLVVTAIHFEKTTLEFATTSISSPKQSYDQGKFLAEKLPHKNLRHVLLFSDGLKVNGSLLVDGITENVPATVSVTGGLVGDGPSFKKTVVGYNSEAKEGAIVAVGLYGKDLKIGFGSLGGWDPFGPSRTITKSKGNILFELDGKSALQLYKKYLGELAKELPASGLLFPLSLTFTNHLGEKSTVVRTLLAVDEKNNSMIFAGDMPEGAVAQLMKANFEKLIDGAENAASLSLESLKTAKPELALLISCVGRKLILKERTVEEVEAVRTIMGEAATITGFYSYGEICPTSATENQCHLHNQTMTITTLKEI